MPYVENKDDLPCPEETSVPDARFNRTLIALVAIVAAVALVGLHVPNPLKLETLQLKRPHHRQ